MKKAIVILLAAVMVALSAPVLVSAAETIILSGERRFGLEEMMEIADVCIFGISAIEVTPTEEGFQQVSFTLVFQNLSISSINLGGFIELGLVFQNRFQFELANPEALQTTIRPLVVRSIVLTFELPNAALIGEYDELILSLSIDGSPNFRLDVLDALGLAEEEDMDELGLRARNRFLFTPGRWMNLDNFAIRLNAVCEFETLEGLPEDIEYDDSERFLRVSLSLRNLMQENLELVDLLSAELVFRDRFVFEYIHISGNREYLASLEETTGFITFLVPIVVLTGEGEELWFDITAGDIELTTEVHDMISDCDCNIVIPFPSQERFDEDEIGTLDLGADADAREVAIWSRVFSDVGDSAEFTASGTDRANNIWLRRRNISHFQTAHNHVVYDLGNAASMFSAILHPHPSPDVTIVYRFFGDDELLHTSPLLMSHLPPIATEINVEGVSQFRIEIEMSNSRNTSHRLGDWPGIENARITTTEPQAVTLPEIPASNSIVTLWNMPFLSVGDSAEFTASGAGRDSNIWLRRRNISHFQTAHNHVVYDLNNAASIFSAILHPHPSPDVTIVYRFFGDEELLHTSPLLMSHIPPIVTEFNVEGVSQFRIEMEMSNSRNTSHRLGDWPGIENARILIPE